MLTISILYMVTIGCRKTHGSNYDLLDGVSEEFASTHYVDWDHPEIDDDYSEDSFVVENKQPHRSFRQLMD